MSRLLLAGYFGAGNLGDDALLLGFIYGLASSRHDVTVMSGAPEETYRNYGLNAIPRKDIKAIDKAIRECDCLVFPGGSVFQDSTSLSSVAYYQHLVKRAKKANKKVVMLGQGVGPLTGFLGKRAAADAFSMADVVAVRDPQSMEALKAIGVRRSVRLTADPALLLPKPVAADGAQEFTVGTMRTVGIAPRPFGKGRATVELFGECCRMLFKANFMPVLIEMDRNEDGAMIQAISKAQGGKIPDLRKVQTPMQLQQRLLRMDAVMAMRLHAGILATTVGIPPFLVSYDPKVTAFGKALDLGGIVQCEGLTASRLFESFMSFQADRDRNQRILERKMEEMTKLARMNIDILLEALSGAAKM